jgi:hypothetical protein
MNLNGQDWDSVVIRKKKPTSSQLKDESAVNAVSDCLAFGCLHDTSSYGALCCCCYELAPD